MSAASATLLLSVRAAARAYLVRRDHVDQIAVLAVGTAPPPDERGRAQVLCDLGALLSPESAPPAGRRHALTIGLRRRSVTLLVERVDDLALATQVVPQPLAPLLARRLERPWFLGVATIDGAPVLLLDLRRIAADVALGVV